jgi:hypothetical protein
VLHAFQQGCDIRWLEQWQISGDDDCVGSPTRGDIVEGLYQVLVNALPLACEKHDVSWDVVALRTHNCDVVDTWRVTECMDDMVEQSTHELQSGP